MSGEQEDIVRNYQEKYTSNFMNLYAATMRAPNSTELVQDLTYSAISTITYMRRVFAKQNYFDQLFDNLTLKTLNANRHECQDMAICLEKAFEAIERRYLKTLVLSVYQKAVSTENLLTSYMLEYNYKEMEVPYYQLSLKKQAMYSLKNVRNSIRRMVQAFALAVADAEISDQRYRARGSLYFGIHLYYNDNAFNNIEESQPTAKCGPAPISLKSTDSPQTSTHAVLRTLHHELTFRSVKHKVPEP